MSRSANVEMLLSQLLNSGEGRSLEELMETDEELCGVESHRLRTFFSNNSMEPHRDLDMYGWAIMGGNFHALQDAYASSLNDCRARCDTEEAARSCVTQQIYNKRWGPTRVPIFNLILLSMLLNPQNRPQHLEIARWLIDEAKVPIDAPDLSGSTALHHAISTKPSFDPEYAQILYDAGGNVTRRNRYGANPAHEITKIRDASDRQVVRRAATALKWFLEHGGNVDVKEADGRTARDHVDSTRLAYGARGFRMEIWGVVDAEDKRRKRLAGQICTFCGREPHGDVKLLLCSKCKTAKYCSSEAPCQRADWPHHKAACKKAAA